jgi:hypothetical protein
VAGNQLTIGSDQQWIVESELFDAPSDLLDLLFGVGAGISLVRPQTIDFSRSDR